MKTTLLAALDVIIVLIVLTAISKVFNVYLDMKLCLLIGILFEACKIRHMLKDRTP